MLVFNYDKESKIYSGSSKAFISPLDKSNFLIPANATTKKVPDYNVDTQYCVFIDDNWVIKSIEIPAPVTELPVSELINKKISEINKINSKTDRFSSSLGFDINVNRNLFTLLDELKIMKDIMVRQNLSKVAIFDADFEEHKINLTELNTVIVEIEDFWYNDNITKHGKIKQAKKSKDKNDLDNIK